MSWMWWVLIGIIALNIVLFGALYVWYLIDGKEKK